MRYGGELAALGTAVFWAAGSNLFAAAGDRMGSVVLNRLRITVAAAMLALTLLVARGAPWPTWASGAQVGLLAVSGVIGFVFADGYFLRAILILGPGRAALLASTSPVFTVLLGGPVLHETPGPLVLLGMALTLGGVFWVLYDRHHRQQSHVEGSVAVGIFCGVLGSLGQSVGYVMSKLALRSGLDPLSATVIRIVAAAVGVWVLAVFQGHPGRSFAALRDRTGALFMLAGAFCGPFVGMALSIVALQTIEAGVAASITAIYPLLAIVLAVRFHGEKLTPKILGGALVAVTGVVVLFLR